MHIKEPIPVIPQRLLNLSAHLLALLIESDRIEARGYKDSYRRRRHLMALATTSHRTDERTTGMRPRPKERTPSLQGVRMIHVAFIARLPGGIDVGAEDVTQVVLAAVVLLLFVAAVCLFLVWLSAMLQQDTFLGADLRGPSDECAEALLRDLLDEQEYQQLTQRGYLDVKSPADAKRVYRIPRRQGLVQMYQDGVAVRDLCLQPVEPLPGADVIALHKLMIQGDEQEYLLHARHFAATHPNQRYRP